MKPHYLSWTVEYTKRNSLTFVVLEIQARIISKQFEYWEEVKQGITDRMDLRRIITGKLDISKETEIVLKKTVGIAQKSFHLPVY